MRIPELQQVLLDAARRQEALASASRGSEDNALARVALPDRAWALARRQGPALRRSRWRALPVLLLLLLGGCAVALASGLISFGAPAASVPVFVNPQAGLGSLEPGSVALLAISVPDPHGGPPWGMRVLRTTRGAGCIQVGRLLDGKLVALGQDGAFGDDARAHALPLSAGIQRLNCSLVDARGRIFDSVTQKSQAASAAGGEYCRPPGTWGPSRRHVPQACPLADERNLYYGMLGPDATSITYTVAGRTRTLATIGADGAYLIVTTGTTHRFTGAAGTRERAGLNVADAVPVYSPIVAIHYRSGAVCHLVTAQRWVYGPSACAPSLPEPFGYTKAPFPTRVRLATPIHTRLVRGAAGGWKILIDFRSRIAISSLSGEYQLEWHGPGMQQGGYAFAPIHQAVFYSDPGMIPTNQDVAAGETLTARIESGRLPGHGALPAGVLSGKVSLRYTSGPLMQTEEDTSTIPVGSFAVRVP